MSELERRRRGEAGAGILAERRHVVLHHEGRPPIREPARYPPPYKSVRFCMESGRGFNGVTLVQTWRRGDCWPDFLRESADRQAPAAGGSLAGVLIDGPQAPRARRRPRSACHPRRIDDALGANSVSPRLADFS